MPVTLIATAGDANANSYATLAEATAYHDTHLYGSTWTDADPDDQARALIWATRILDAEVDWVGAKYTAAQALRWPRSSVLDRDGYTVAVDAIPTFLKQATAELARWLLTEDRTAERGFGITRLKADVVELEFDKSDERPLLPDAVLSLIAGYGSAGAQVSGVVKLVRV